MSDEAIGRRWAREQELLGLARGTPGATFATGGLGALAVRPTVRIVVLPADPSALAVPAQDPAAIIPPYIEMPGGSTSPASGVIRGTSSGYVGYPDPGKGHPWPRYIALHSHGGVDFYLGSLGGQDADEQRELPRLIWLRRGIAWAWGAFTFQQHVARRHGIAGPFRAIIGVAGAAGAALGDLGTGWAEPGGPGSPKTPTAVEPQVLLHEDVPSWPDAAGLEALALRFGARLDLAFGGPGQRHLDKDGPEAGRFRPPHFSSSG
jgi:hypothetical protein